MRGRTISIIALAFVALLLPLGLYVNAQEGSEAAPASTTKYEFQAEVNRLLQILINSLYTTKDIFLRELISNASDALDKIRFLALTDTDVLGEKPDLDIRIIPDKENGALRIRDSGIGMTRQDLINNLGTIAKSGTRGFLEALTENADLNLIGQFGVGFYSAFLVADSVTVITKHNNDVQLIWESSADNTFSISEDPAGNTLGRGTEIVLHLKEDAKDFLEEDKLRDLIRKYSEFIHFPIYLHTSKTIEKEVPIEESAEEIPIDDAQPEEADISDETDAEAEEDKPKTKTISETVNEFVRVNENKPIWTRSPKEVQDEEYNAFYKSISKEYDDPVAHIHFTAEGDIQFRSILFVPGHASTSLFENYGGKSQSIKLYVRRVFITDEFSDLMPRYLNFVRGIVDSEDLPLNVSREILQQSRLIQVIKRKLVRKALEMFQNLADEGKPKKDEESSEDNSEEVAEKKTAGTNEKYLKFWNEFGKNIRLGIMEDSANRNKLASLLRYETSKSEGGLIGLDEYIERAGENQKYIYYITGESKEAVENSPFLEELRKRDLEVVYMLDPIDEYALQHLTEYEGKKLMSVTKEGLKFSDETEEDKEEEKSLKEEFKPLTEWLKNMMSEQVDKAIVSKRLASTPAILVSSQYGPTANMERILRAQALGDPSRAGPKSRKILEINPASPIISNLLKKVSENTEDEEAKETARLLYDTALLQSGFPVDDTKAFADRVHKLMTQNVQLEADVTSTHSESASTGRDEL